VDKAVVLFFLLVSHHIMDRWPRQLCSLVRGTVHANAFAAAPEPPSTYMPSRSIGGIASVKLMPDHGREHEYEQEEKRR
jgi:hypothetical protein